MQIYHIITSRNIYLYNDSIFYIISYNFIRSYYFIGYAQLNTPIHNFIIKQYTCVASLALSNTYRSHFVYFSNQSMILYHCITKKLKIHHENST